MMISVVMPTVDGREVIVKRVLRAYAHWTEEPQIEILLEKNHPTVGCAWQAGAERATGDYIHLGNDDCEPREGWWQPAVEACDAGFLPSPMVYDPTGYAQSLPEWGKVAGDWTPVHCAMIPFMSRAMWEKIRPLFTGHYHTDNFITDRAFMAGWPCRLRTGYAFTHYWAQPGRGAGMEEGQRMAYDQRLYRQALTMAQEGTWEKPWPPGGRADG